MSSNLPASWEPLDPEEAERLHAELQRELPSGHLLYGVAVEAVATRPGIDDVLFRHRDREDRFTVIHLSWLGRTEINAKHPTVAFDGSFAGFLAEEKRLLNFIHSLAEKKPSNKTPKPPSIMPRASENRIE